ncbi:KfrB domain-containing protein [Methylovorus glucosotrophus]|uniref:Uncharacterized protein n=1 Tax=Methylovorus glucosotrophus (strain SIP3-4) TaxID=582744 RepID=C6XEM7_METGS|nr:DUF6036 family nucleotidyltransferase [Methylovorus glucosotrophus]ACT52084.1 hypothetical protein Msip34_2860 [Methylovorus glucosotrophus SIP3-4]
MRRSDIEHLLRAAGDVLNETAFIVVGSQSILGKYPDAPAELLQSAEADLIAKNKPEQNHKLEVLGELSPFHDMYGYFADPVDRNTAILPKGWEGRLVNLKTPATNGVTGLCLDPHDLFVSKMAAGRDKDLIYCRVMIEHNLVGKERVLALAATLKNTPDDPERNKRILMRIERMYEGVDVANTIHVDIEKGYYTGKVISVSDTVVQQEAGRGKMIFHEAARLDIMPIRGRSYDIKYREGSAKVEQKVLAKDKKLEL